MMLVTFITWSIFNVHDGISGVLYYPSRLYVIFNEWLGHRFSIKIVSGSNPAAATNNETIQEMRNILLL